MEFKSLTNIETSFRHLRLFGIVYLGVCTLLVGFSVWKAYSFAEAQRQKIYVLDEGKSLMLALSQDLEQNRPVEAREHVRRFHELFYSLAPDKDAIESNIQRAMFLSDRSAYTHYVDLAEQGYYNRVISGMRLQRLPVWRHYLCPAFHHQGEERHGAEPRDAGTAAQFHAQRQQPARVHPGGVPRAGEQGYQNV